MKHETSVTFHSIAKANVKVFEDKQMDRPKTVFPPIYLCGGIKIWFLYRFKSLPKKILDQSTLKVFAREGHNVAQTKGFVFGRVKNIERKEEHPGQEHSFFTYFVFKNPLLLSYVYRASLYTDRLSYLWVTD